MARHASMGTMLAATVLFALPALAQTTGGTSTGATPAPSSPGMTSPGATSPGMGPAVTPRSNTTAAAPAPATPKYFTSDHQVRVSKVVGASVYNDKNESIGSIDDVLMGDSDHKAGTAVLSVGGFLGMGAKLVSVPFDQLQINDDKIVMPGASKASLEGMPDFHYTRA